MTSRRPPTMHPAHWSAGEWFAAFTLAGALLCYLVRMTLDVNQALAIHSTRIDGLEQRINRLENAPAQ